MICFLLFCEVKIELYNKIIANGASQKKTKIKLYNKIIIDGTSQKKTNLWYILLPSISISYPL